MPKIDTATMVFTAIIALFTSMCTGIGVYSSMRSTDAVTGEKVHGLSMLVDMQSKQIDRLQAASNVDRVSISQNGQTKGMIEALSTKVESLCRISVTHGEEMARMTEALRLFEKRLSPASYAMANGGD